MFGIGFSEIMLICLVAIIFIRPDDLPKALRTIGRYYGKAKKFYNDLILVKDRILKEIDEVTTLEEPKNTPKTSSGATKPDETKVVQAGAAPEGTETVTEVKEPAPAEPQEAPSADSTPKE